MVEVDKDPDDFEIILIIYPNVKQIIEKENRVSFTGSIQQIGNDIEKVKEMNVEHVILNYNRSAIQNNMNMIINVFQQLLPYVRS